MKIIEQATTPEGIEIQLEDWSEHNTEKFPNLYGFTIAAYPIAKNSSYWIRGGKSFRLGVSINEYMSYSNDDVKSDFEALKNGSKRLEDLADHFWNGRKDMYYLGMISERPESVYMGSA